LGLKLQRQPKPRLTRWITSRVRTSRSLLLAAAEMALVGGVGLPVALPAFSQSPGPAQAGL
jgi:hypothetical protein